jgi:uronate dehydrogenase
MSGLEIEMAIDRVLLTGAAGRVGTVLRPALASRYPNLRLLDRLPMSDLAANEEAVQADLTDADEIAKAMNGVDAVVHLAGISRIGDWDDILPLNIAATYALFDAARRNAVKRIVFASSHHAVGYYLRERVIDHQVPVRPDCGYGLSKVFGEAAAQMFADKFALTCISLRIGTCAERPYDRRTLSTWISHRDMQHLSIVALEADIHGHEIVYGVSGNDRSIWDNARALELGYRPQDNAERYADEVLKLPDTEDPISAKFHGGSFAAHDFAGFSFAC